MEGAEFDFGGEIHLETPAATGAGSFTAGGKRRKEVCKFFLMNSCHRENCPFLHEIDPDRLPECPYGFRCSNKDCPFRHTPDAEKDECINYRLGFCSFGPICNYRHVQRAPEELPPISELWTTSYLAHARAKERIEEKPHQFRVAMCSVFKERGWCAFFDACGYAHSEAQIRRWFPGMGGHKRPRDQMSGGSDTRGPAFGAGAAAAAPAAMAMGGGAMPGPPAKRARPLGMPPDVAMLEDFLIEADTRGEELGLPDRPDAGAAAAAALLGIDATGDTAAGGPGDSTASAGSAPSSCYFIARSMTITNFLLCLRNSEWVTHERAGAAVEDALRQSASGQVFLFFSSLNSEFFQGVARVRAPPHKAPPGVTAAAAGDGSADDNGKYVVVPLEWLLTCDLPFAETAGLRNPLANGAQLAKPPRDLQPLTPPLGRALMLLHYRAPAQEVNTSVLPADALYEVIDDALPAHKDMIAAENAGSEVEAAAAAVEQAAAAAMRGPMMGGPPPFGLPFGAMPPRGMFPPGMPMPPPGMAGPPPGMPVPPGGWFPPPGMMPGPGGPTAAAVARSEPEGIKKLGGASMQQLGDAVSRYPPVFRLLHDLPMTPHASALVTTLEAGILPHGCPSPEAAAADALVRGQQGFIFGCSNVTQRLCQSSGVFIATEDQHHIGDVRPGTPCMLYNVHTKALIGLYIARTSAISDLVPRGTYPPMVIKAGGVARNLDFSWQCQTLEVLAAPPMPPEAYAPIMGPKVGAGVVAPRAMTELVTKMLRAAGGPPLLFHVAAALRQLEALGLPPFGRLHKGWMSDAPSGSGAAAAGAAGGDATRADAAGFSEHAATHARGGDEPATTAGAGSSLSARDAGASASVPPVSDGGGGGDFEF